MKASILATVTALAMVGCSTYDHGRFDPVTGKKIETTSIRNVMMNKNVAGISGITTDSNGTNKYSRTVEIKGLQSKGDAEFLKAGIEAAKTVNGMP